MFPKDTYLGHCDTCDNLATTRRKCKTKTEIKVMKADQYAHTLLHSGAYIKTDYRQQENGKNSCLLS